MASSAVMPEPVRVSPLIRVGRWSFLAMGIMWGISRNRSLTKKENRLRELDEQQHIMIYI
ncbi:ATP synthase subunit e, mitochondrial [Orchesella cincta]|uniref:ATP synthase F(0) complex subunit e, mitochondrial n=1 Tax=Orchesella cincta TaxID=48709 RepID=A0A1D2N9H7_ORCCI|nr:ATP synthase subunit e, mitochondrial [Orchesella cincta]